MVIAIDLDSVICKSTDRQLLNEADETFCNSEEFNQYLKERAVKYGTNWLNVYNSRSTVLKNTKSDKESVEYLKRIKKNNDIILLTSYGTDGNWNERPAIFEWLSKEDINYDMVLFDSDKAAIAQLFNVDVVITADNELYSELMNGKYTAVPFLRSNIKGSIKYIEWSRMPEDWR